MDTQNGTQPAKVAGRDGWRTTAQLFLASVHRHAEVLFNGIAGILFLKHFSWKAAFYSPTGVRHIPTAGWHTAGVWKRLYTHFLCRLI